MEREGERKREREKREEICGETYRVKKDERKKMMERRKGGRSNAVAGEKEIKRYPKP